MPSSGTQHNAFFVLAAGGAIPAGTRVKIASGVLAAADATDAGIGFAESTATAAGELVTVRLAGQPFVAIVGVAVTAGALLYNAASGKLHTTSAGDNKYVALETSSTADSLVAVVKIV